MKNIIKKEIRDEFSVKNVDNNKWITHFKTAEINGFINRIMYDGFWYNDQLVGWSQTADNVALFYYDELPINRLKELKKSSSATQSYWALRALHKIFDTKILDLPINWVEIEKDIKKGLDKHTSIRHLATSILLLCEIFICKKDLRYDKSRLLNIIKTTVDQIIDISFENISFYDASYIVSGITSVLKNEIITDKNKIEELNILLECCLGELNKAHLDIIDKGFKQD